MDCGLWLFDGVNRPHTLAMVIMVVLREKLSLDFMIQSAKGDGFSYCFERVARPCDTSV